MNSYCQRCKSNPISSYRCGLSLCLSCSPAYAAPTLPSILQVSGATRVCQCCKNEVSNSVAKCACGYVELGVVPEQNSPPAPVPRAAYVSIPQVPNPCWRCDLCGFEYNTKATCLKCSDEQSVQSWVCECGYENHAHPRCEQCSRPKDTHTGQIVHPGSVSKAAIKCGRNPDPNRSALWECTVCKYQFNPSRYSLCQSAQCQAMLKEERPTEELLAEDSQWMCPDCGNENSRVAEVCLQCNLQKGWNHYLEYKGVLMNADQTRWVCSCGYTEEITRHQCSKCSKVNEPILKGLAGRGSETSLLGKVMSWLSFSQ